MTPEPLPIDAVLPPIVEAARVGPCVVVQAPTGAGKTTRVPPALLDAGLAGERMVLVVEPRRVAARAAARRIAAERGQRLGEAVGYHVRFDRCAGPATRLLVITPGLLLQMLHGDPLLERVGVVVFDEFHERQLDADLALGFTRLIQGVRPDLKIVAMSATIAATEVATYLAGCSVIASEGRLHPVEIRYEPKPPTAPWPVATAAAVRRLAAQSPGDVLAFLPGMYEIRATMRELSSWADDRDVAVLPLHGDLPAAEQDAALQPCGRRKIVLATNVAETSVTVEGITGVVDTGLAREMSFDASVGLDRLRIVNISQASADQRAGRAGRTQSGICVRLWAENTHRGRAAQTAPEVARVDLAGAVLQLFAHGEADVAHFPWLEPPPAESLTRALALLGMLGAVEAGKVTELGRQLARLPVHPRLGRMLVEGARHGQVSASSLAAALLAERDPFRRARSSAVTPTQSDLLDRVEAVEQFARDGKFMTPLGELDGGAARFVLRARDQLARSAADIPAVAPTSAAEAVLRAVLAAFPDRVCKRRNPGGRKGVMVGGRGVRLENCSGVDGSPLFVAVDVDAGKEETLVRLASGIEAEWLPTEEITQSVNVEWDDSAGRLIAWKRTRFGDLVIEQTPTVPPEGETATTALVDAALRQPAQWRPAAESPAGMFRTRVRCLRDWRPELALPNLDEADEREILAWLASSCRSIGELARADWLTAYQSRLTREQVAALDREAPEKILVPSGNRIALQYEEGRPPVLAVRIQELFGLRESPRLAQGRAPVLLHLLAPNYRPQQVTTDLASFWANTYPVVRKDLRGRYPKHAWPEDPLSATPPARKR